MNPKRTRFVQRKSWEWTAWLTILIIFVVMVTAVGLAIFGYLPLGAT